MQDRQSTFNPTEQLNLLIDKCSLFRPEVYKLNALYLQLIREALPLSVRECIYQLILSSKNNISTLLLDNNKEDFREIIDKLINECISFLTVENLIAFSKTIDKEKNLSSNDSSIESLDQEQIENIEEKTSLNYNNVSLSNSLEIESRLPINESLDFNDWNTHKIDIDNLNYINQKESDEVEKVDNSGNRQNESIESAQNNIEPDLDKSNTDILKSIFEIAANIVPGKKVNNPIIQSDSQDEDAKISFMGDESKQDFLLPNMPDELSLWTLSIEQALNRRLRNLSHLINIELLRIGIINSFVPVNLLDAVILAQINSANSPSNILNLRLPVSSPIKNELEITCLLIRPSELEFDDIKLRQCRQKITQQQNILLKMIRQQRYWQNRSLANEFREKWWTNTANKKKV